MSEYGLDISQIVSWTYPQLRLVQQARDARQKHEKVWQIILASGSLGEEGVDTLIEGVTGKAPPEREPRAEKAQEVPHTLDHGVDSQGNVKAAGAPLLSDIALGKANIPGALGNQIIRVRKTT